MVRIVFNAKISDRESQRNLLRETFEPQNALKITINFEMGLEGQFKIFTSTTHTNDGSKTNFVTLTRAANTRKSNNKSIGNRKLKLTCQNCRQDRSFEQREMCPAQGKN